MIYLFFLTALLGLPFRLQAAPAQTDLSSFVHQITLRRDSIDTRVSQWVSPLQVRLPFASGYIEVQSALMYARQTGLVRESVWGALNTRIDGRWALGNHALVSLHTSLPTGKQALDHPDADLVRLLSRNDLNFPVKTFGQGLDAGGALSLVRHRGHWSLSLGGGYAHKGAYEPIAGVVNYKPGDEISGSVGFDYTYDRFVYRLSARGAYYLTDRQEGLVVFRNGKQLLLQSEMRYTGRYFRLKVELSELARLKNQELSNGRFLFETRDSNGNDFRARLEASLTPTSFITLFATGYFKHLTSNAHPPGSPLYQGGAHLLEGGGGIALSIGPAYHLVLQGTRLTGKAEDGAVALSAFNARAGLSIAF